MNTLSSIGQTLGDATNDYGTLRSSFSELAKTPRGSFSSESTDDPVTYGRGEIKSYCQRWLMLALFCGLTFTNSFLWIAFSPIEIYVEQYYEVSPTAVNFLSVSFMILYLPGSILSAHLLSTVGFRNTMVCGGLLNVCGGWIRYLSVFVPTSAGTLRFSVLMLGQIFAALGQPFFTNTSAKLAGTWFGPSERDIATVIASLVNPIGNAAGQVVPPMYVSCGGDGKNVTCNSPQQVDGLGDFLLAQAAVASLTSLATFLFFRDAPPTPPSLSAARRGEEEASTSSILNNVRTLARDAEFQKIMIGFGIGVGIFNALMTMLAQILEPAYHERGTGSVNKSQLSTDAGMYGLILITAGLVGAMVFGVVLDKTHAYRLSLKLLFSAGTVGIAGFLFSVRPNNGTWITAWTAFAGFCALPLLPVALQCAVECTYPIPEELSSALLLLTGNIVGVGFTFGFQALLATPGFSNWYDYKEQTTPCFYFGTGVMAFACVHILMYKGDYKRLALETSQTEERTNTYALVQ